LVIYLPTQNIEAPKKINWSIAVSKNLI